LKTILVTGSNGFIGKNLITFLIETGHRVVRFESYGDNIINPSIWEKIPKVDLVFHLAAKTSILDSWTNIFNYIENNSLASINVLEYCKKNKSKIIYLSSYLYGKTIDFPISENAIIDVTNPYALSKKIAEEICLFYNSIYNIDIAIVRPFNVYGCGQNESFLIPSIIKQVQYSESIIVRDLTPRRDYIYISDFINALVRFLEVDSISGIYNLGSGISYSVMDVISIIQKIYGTQKPIINSVACIFKIKNKLQWEPKFNLQSGLIDMLKKNK